MNYSQSAKPQEFDLNISNYTFNDIKRLFRLPQDYTRDQVNYKEVKLREQLIKSGHIDQRFQQSLVGFLDDAKKWLIDALPPLSPPKTIPKAMGIVDPYPDFPHLVPPPADRQQEVIQRPPTQFIYSQPSEYFPGIVNPLDKRVLTKIVNINTLFRQTYNLSSATDFTLTLPDRITKVVSMRLASIEIPITYYNVSAKLNNNYLYITATDDYIIPPAETVISIPPGNYTTITLLATINSLLSPRDPEDESTMLEPDSIFSYIQLAYDNITGLITIGTLERDPPITEITLDFTRDANGIISTAPVPQHIGNVLGFTKFTYTGLTTYIGEAPLYLETNPYVFLVVDDFNNNVNNNGFTSAFMKSQLGSNILARITTANQTDHFGKTLVMDDQVVISNPRTYFGPVDIQKLHIRLVDEYGRTFDLNKRDYSFCLELKTLYDL